MYKNRDITTSNMSSRPGPEQRTTRVSHTTDTCEYMHCKQMNIDDMAHETFTLHFAMQFHSTADVCTDRMTGCRFGLAHKLSSWLGRLPRTHKWSSIIVR